MSGRQGGTKKVSNNQYSIYLVICVLIECSVTDTPPTRHMVRDLCVFALKTASQSSKEGEDRLRR